MKKQTLFLVLVLALTSLLLSGCFSVTQEMWVNPDGSGKVSIDMGMSTALLDMAGADADPLKDFSTQFEGNSTYKNVTTRTYEEGDLKHIVVEFEVDSFEQYITNPGGSTDQSLDTSVTLTKLENGNYKLVQKVAGTDPGEMDEDSKNMMKSMFEDKYWTTKIHVPQVVSTNGTNGGSVAEWKIPLADLMMGGAPIQMELEYSLTPGTPGWLWPVIIGLVVLIVALVAFFLLRRKKVEPAPVATYPPYPPVPPVDNPPAG